MDRRFGRINPRIVPRRFASYRERIESPPPGDAPPPYRVNGHDLRQDLREEWITEASQGRRDISDDDLRRWAERVYAEAKPLWERGDKNGSDATAYHLCASAIVLFVWGRIDVATDIFDTIKYQGKAGPILIRSVKALLPLTEDVVMKMRSDNIHSNDYVREWVVEHEHELVWDETAGFYKFRE